MQIVFIPNEVIGEGVEQFGITRRIGGAHVIDGFDESAAKEVCPYAVSEIARKPGIARIRQPVGEFRPPIAWLDLRRHRLSERMSRDNLHSRCVDFARDRRHP